MNIADQNLDKFNNHIKLGEFDKAIFLANSVSRQWPDQPVGFAMLGDALMYRGDLEKATSCYLYALQKDPNLPEVSVALGEAYFLSGEPGKAYHYFYQALKQAPDNADILKKTGHMLIMAGRLNDATSVLNEAMKLGAADATQALLDLKIHIGNKIEIEKFVRQNEARFLEKGCDLTYVRAEITLGNHDRMIRLLEDQDISCYSPTRKAAYYHLLASAYEAGGDFPKAFDFYARQNAERRLNYSRANMERKVQEIVDNSSRMNTSMVKYQDLTEQEFTPLFIIGLPRSGTSLLEQVLNTSDHVVAGGELLFVEAAYKKYFEKREPLEQVSHWYREKVEFITKNQEIPKTAPRWLTDKLPANFVNVGFIKNMVPDAKFLYCTRNPLDNGLSIFKQDFLHRHSYATRLEDIAHFIALERRIMQHWIDRFPGLILEVRYEDLVTDFDAQTRRIFDYCDLTWSPEVRDFHNSGYYCNTASFDQVRKPVYSTSVGFNRRYRKQLDPLREHLESLEVPLI